MLEVLADFIDELRDAGLPVSLSEAIDAAQAVTEVGLQQRAVLRATLSATLIKHLEHRASFEQTFDTFFSARVSPGFEAVGDAPLGAGAEPGHSSDLSTNAHEDAASVVALARAALVSGEPSLLARAGAAAVARYGALDPSRPVGVSYYLQRTLRGLDFASLLTDVLSVALAGMPPDSLSARLVREDYDRRASTLREAIVSAIRAELVSARGARVVARSLRKGLLEDLDFMHASSEELAAMRRSIYPLARILATRLSQRRRRGRKGPLDFRATLRRSLSSGGVPIDLHFRPPHPSRPELFLFADVSGSVASFARFTLQLIWAISSQFSKVRTVVFIDGVDEVTDLFRRSTSLTDALGALSERSAVVAGDGHSDYGNALALLHDRYARAITNRTNLLVLGDARTNYHAPRAELLKDLARRARRLYWLNPEPVAYWGSGDSVMDQYGRYCDAVVECRNLRQLKAFVEQLA